MHKKRTPAALHTKFREDSDTAAIEADEIIQDETEDNDDLEEWLETANATQYGFKATLFEIKDRRKWIVYEWKNEIPTIHDIGLKFGGGCYEMYIVIHSKDKKNRIKTRRFNISNHYDTMRAQPAPVAIGASPQATSNGHFSESLALIKEVINAISPMMNKNPMLDMSQIAVSQFSMMQEIMRQSVKENMAMAKAVLKREYESLEEADEIEEEETPAPMAALPAPAQAGNDDLVSTIITAISPYLSKILGNEVDSGVIISTIKALPQYQSIMQDRQNLQKVIAGFKANFGEDKTKALMGKFGVQI
jgi:hypothetical protein